MMGLDHEDASPYDRGETRALERAVGRLHSKLQADSGATASLSRLCASASTACFVFVREDKNARKPQVVYAV